MIAAMAEEQLVRPTPGGQPAVAQPWWLAYSPEVVRRTRDCLPQHRAGARLWRHRNGPPRHGPTP